MVKQLIGPSLILAGCVLTACSNVAYDYDQVGTLPPNLKPSVSLLPIWKVALRLIQLCCRRPSSGNCKKTGSKRRRAQRRICW